MDDGRREERNQRDGAHGEPTGTREGGAGDGGAAGTSDEEKSPREAGLISMNGGRDYELSSLSSRSSDGCGESPPATPINEYFSTMPPPAGLK